MYIKSLYRLNFSIGVLLVALLYSCTTDEGDVEIIINDLTEINLADSTTAIIVDNYSFNKEHFLLDTADNMIILFELGGQKRWLSFDYEKHEIIASEKIDFSLKENNLTIGRYRDQSEILLAKGRFIDVYYGATLKFKLTIEVFEESDFQEFEYISGIQFHESLIFVTTCNSPNRQITIIDRSDPSRIWAPTRSTNCRNLIAFSNEDSIGVISTSYSTSRPFTYLDWFTKEGVHIGNVISPDRNIDWHFMRINNTDDYAILNKDGDIYSKKTLLKIGSLPRSNFGDCFLMGDRSSIIALTTLGERLHVYAYPDFRTELTLWVREFLDDFITNSVSHVFYDNGKIMCIGFNNTHTNLGVTNETFIVRIPF